MNEEFKRTILMFQINKHWNLAHQLSREIDRLFRRALKELIQAHNDDFGWIVESAAQSRLVIC